MGNGHYIDSKENRMAYLMMKQMEDQGLTEYEARKVVEALSRMLEVNSTKQKLTIHFQYEEEVNTYFSDSCFST